MAVTCCPREVNAGNPVVISAIFSPPHEDDDVTGSTAVVTVMKPSREEVAAEGVATNVVDGKVVVDANWDVPADARFGTYKFRIIISGGMTARREFPFEVVPW